MLITFTCPAYADITMFGDIGIQLLKYMGHSGQVPGALMAEDIQQALKLLQEAIEADRQLEVSQQPSNEEDDEPLISLSHRALPLIELLNAAAKAECNVMWDSNN